MTANSVLPSFPTFKDVDGNPLEAGFIYIGLPNLNPEVAPKQTYFDKELTIPAPQPIRTIGGYPSRNGTPSQIYVDGEFSLTVRDKNGALIYNAATEQLRFSPLISGIYDFRDVSTLLADTGSGFGAGSIWRTRSEGFSYEEAPTSATDHHVTTAGGVKLYVMPGDAGFDVRAFGPVGDGIADDTARIQAAFSAAAKNQQSVVITPGTYLHTDRLIVRNGTTAVLGAGGTLKAANGNCGILLAGIQSGEPINVTNCDVRGVQFDANGTNCTPIEGQNAANCNVMENNIFGVVDGHGIVFRSYVAGGRNTVFVNISNNRVALNANSFGVARHAICLDVLNAELNFAPYANEKEYFENEFTAALPTFYADQCVVANNITFGGYYGLSLAGARRTTVTGNVFQSNTRNISIQHGCLWNVISGNSCTQSGSSAIHMAFGSSRNVVTGNKIRNTANGGEALIQCYLGASDNTIAGNQIESIGSTGNQYFIYIGPKCDRCVVEGNNCTGNASRGGIAVESAWNTAIDNPYSYAFGKTLNEVTNANLTGVAVKNNYVDLNFVRPAIMLLAVSGASTNHDLEECVVNGNTVTNNTPFRQFEITEFGASLVRNLHMVGNKFAAASGPTRFVLPRGWEHFMARRANAKLDTDIVAFPNGETTPSIGYGSGLFNTANSAPTSITNFVGGGLGLTEITIKLDANTTIVHNNSLIRLRGNANIVATSANDFVTLRRFANIWFEVSRNF